jgi:hypothetical protein
LICSEALGQEEWQGGGGGGKIRRERGGAHSAAVRKKECLHTHVFVQAEKVKRNEKKTRESER